MSWGMPTAAAAWNPGMAMTPEMANYTPEQWAALQQQNWQQWTQWQQQYAQWQSQYGEKYAQQMQAMQTMGGMPPLPTGGGVAPPAPPPPDKPPPPPPHENNQPLFGNKQNASGPTPVPAPNQQIGVNVTGYNNTNNAGNNQNWSNTSTAPRPVATQGAGNSEALKKLAEEERLFDIQFQKWEEEIEKWKKENQNHPDKEAYKEYEAKFEACRVQLLERRQQMKQRRARLLGHPAPPANNAVAGNNNNNTSSNIPSLMQTPIKPPTQTNIKPLMQTPIQTSPNLNQNHNKQSQNYNNNPPQSYGKKDVPQNQQYNVPQTSYDNRNSNKNVDPQGRFEAYHTMEDYSSSSTEKTTFLPPSASSKGIPGLDLVPETDKSSAAAQDVIDITDDGQSNNMKAPDYSTISKGINNILGDEKIMNILSMVRVQSAPTHESHNMPPRTNNFTGPSAHSGPSGLSGPSGGYGGPPGPNNYSGPSSSNTYSGSAGPNTYSGPPGPGNQGPPGPNSHGPSGPSYGNNANNFNNIPQNNQWDRNDNQYNNQQQYNNRPNMPHNRQGPPPSHPMNSQGQGPNRMYEGPHQDMPESQYYDRNDYSNGNKNMGPPPLMSLPHGRPPPIDMAGQQNFDDFRRRPPMDNNDMHDRRLPPNRLPGPGMHETMPMNQPPRPAWVEEPLFTPSIIVEYEHKPLRLKAREFIEPVHMFDYDHKSKDDEYKKKDFEKEVDELFTRKPRRHEDDFPHSDRFSREPADRFLREPERYPRDSFERFDREPTDRFPREPVDRFSREPIEKYAKEPPERLMREPISRDFERRPRDEVREIDDHRSRLPPREEYEERRRGDPVFDRRRDDRDRFSRRDDYRDREDHRDRDRDRERNDHRDRDRDRFREARRDEPRLRSKSRDRDVRKRGRSKDSEISNHSKRSKDDVKVPQVATEELRNVIMIDDILESPGREMRPEKIVIILRGPPGSGKSYLAKLIRDREAEYGGAARIMSIDDYFMQEGEIEEKDPTTGKMIKKPTLKYEYDESLEETYLNSLKRAFKRSITDGYFNFLIYDANNDQLKSYADIWNFSRQNGFQVYICTMELDAQTCYKRNIHKRTLDDIQVICSRFFPTPNHHLQLDATTLLQNAAIQDVQMEDAIEEVHMEDVQETEALMPKGDAPLLQVENSFTSKWEKMDDAAQLARLDGTSKPLRPSQLSMEDYLQLDDWKPNTAKPGKKTVRWADIEERRQQEKMRAIGFVVGQTDWNRMTDPTMGSSALTQTKYIERVRRN